MVTEQHECLEYGAQQFPWHQYPAPRSLASQARDIDNIQWNAGLGHPLAFHAPACAQPTYVHTAVA